MVPVSSLLENFTVCSLSWVLGKQEVKANSIGYKKIILFVAITNVVQIY